MAIGFLNTVLITSTTSKRGFNYSNSGTKIGKIDEYSPLPIYVSTTNKVDFQCPESISNTEFLSLVQAQERQYFEILSRYWPCINDKKVFMPASGSLLNFVSTLHKLNVTELFCSDITPSEKNYLGMQNKKTLQDNGIVVELLHQTNAIEHVEKLIISNTKFSCIILPWFSMYLDLTEYNRLISGCFKLLTNDGVICERYSASQAFNQPSSKLAMKTTFRSNTQVKQIYEENNFNVIEDEPITAFSRWSASGRRYLIAQKNQRIMLTESI